MKKLSKILSVLLCLAMLVGVVAVMVGAEETTYTLVTDASTLSAGDRILIGATKDGTTYYAGDLSGKYLSSQSSTDEATVYVLGGEAGAWTLTSESGTAIKYKANKELTSSADAGTATWTISVDESGAATIASTANTGSRILYNAQSPRFLNYASDTNVNMLLPNIYKVSGSSSEETTEGTTEGSVETTVTVVENPEAGVAYKMGMYQGTKGENLYFTGEMNGFYYATSNNVADGVDVYLEETEGGYYIYFTDANGQQYLYLEKSGKYNNVKIGETKQVFTFGDYNNVETELEGSALYLGTYGNNTTIGASNMSYIEGDNASKVDAANGQYVVRLYTVTTEDTEEPTTPPSESEGEGSGEDDEEEIPVFAYVPDGTYVIVSNDGTKALSSIYPDGSYYNSAVDVTVADGKVTGYANTELWTVTTVDGVTTITLYGTENKLGLGEKYNSMKVGGEDNVHSDWILLDAGEGKVYIENTRVLDTANKLYNTIEYSSYGNWDVTGDTYKKGLLLIAADPIVDGDEEPEESTGATEESTAPSEESSEATEESTGSNVSGDTGDKTPGDTLTVFVGLLAVSTVGLAVVTSKKKEF